MTETRPDNEVIFHAARDIPELDRRREYVHEACSGDEARIAHIEALLAAAVGPDSLLDRPAAAALMATIDQPTSERPGMVIGPYKLIEPIGEGGMGSVWMAQQTQPVKRLVAVKLIKAGMDSRQVIARFEAERQALALMDHPNIARVLDAGTSSAGRPFFVMDLVKGVPITRYCDEHHLTPRQRLELFIPVCQAVQHAHQKGIIHRDLKPSNVLVALYDGKPVPKIIDFGVAKAAGQQLTDKTLVTGFGSIVGTLEYMSPEQAEVNQLDIDTRCDIYSLGVLLYELLAGSPPFSRQELTQAGMLETLRVIREQEPSKPSAKLSTADGLPTLAANRGTEPAKLTKLVRGELDWIVMKALEKDRNRRYETANGFAMDVQNYLSDEPVQACPPSAGYRFRKFARRNKGGLAVAALVLFFLALLGSGTNWVLRNRSAREAELREAVTAALDKVTDLRQRARWGEAQAVLEQARQRLGPSGAEDLRRQVKQADDDLALVDLLEAARLKASAVAGNRLDSASAAREYAAAFREAGVGEETEAAEVVADRIRSRAVREQLVAAVDDWAVRVDKQESTRLAWLLAVARAADPDPWRNRFRDAAVWNDRAALERLAREANVNEVSPQILFALGTRLRNLGADALPLLKEARRRYPSDFWLNLNLGGELCDSGQWEEAVVYCQAALALRPAAAVVYNNLAVAVRGKGRVDEAIAEFQRAIELDPKYALARNNLGFTLRATGRVDEGIAEHRKAIELEPKFVDAHFRLGDALREKGRVDEAVAEYRKTIELDPKHVEVHKNLAVALRENGRVNEAIVEYQKAIELEPNFAGAHKDLGNALRDKGRLDEAIVAYQKAIELEPKDVQAHNGLGIALRQKGALDEAIVEHQKAIELEPKYAGAHNDLGNALRDKGRVDEAIAEYQKAIELDPKFVHPHIGLGHALRQEGGVDEAIVEYQKAIELAPNFAGAHHDLGNALREKGRVDEAVVAYERSIELDPKFAHPHASLGNALRQKGGVDEAIVEYQKAIELDPNFTRAHHDLGDALRDKGRVDEAIVEYQKAIKLDPEHAHAHNILGNTLQERGRVDEAVAAYQKAIELDANVAGAHHDLGNALRVKGSVDEAIVAYQKAIELAPNLARAHHDLGNALRDKGRVDEAIVAYQKAIELEPKYVLPHTGLGLALRQKGRVDEAIVQYQKAIELEPNFAGAHNDLGNALRDKGRVDEAIVAYQKAIELEPNFAHPHTGLGNALRQKGRVDEAIAEYQKAIKLEPKEVNAHTGLGVALKAKGELDEAIAAFEDVIRRQPDFTAAHFELASVLAEARQWDRSASVYSAALKRFGVDPWPGPLYKAIRSDEVFARLTAQQPHDRLPWIIRARLRVIERDWKRAAADYARVYESLASIDPANLLPEGGDDLFNHGCVLLLLGDHPGYEQFCKKWADRVGDSPAWWYFLARAWAVSPVPVVPSQQIVERAEKTLQAGRTPWSLHALSLAHYRNAQFKLAIERALESNGGNWSGSAKALNGVVLAMAHSRLGHAADARKFLEQALELAGQASTEQPPGVEWPNMAPSEFVEFELLRREAEELINPKSKEQPDKK